jgi:hypothetical protein
MTLDTNAERYRTAVALAAATVLPVGAALALVPLRNTTPAPTIALALAAIVTLLAATGTRATAAIAAVSASVGFDVFHTRPYGSLVITRPQTMGFPTKEVSLVVEHQGRPLGRYVLVAQPGTRVTEDQLLASIALADLAASALAAQAMPR